MSDQQPTVTKREVVDAMYQHGGAFIHRLALAWYAADDSNRFLIEAMWGPEWREYTALAQQIKKALNER